MMTRNIKAYFLFSLLFIFCAASSVDNIESIDNLLESIFSYKASLCETELKACQCKTQNGDSLLHNELSLLKTRINKIEEEYKKLKLSVSKTNEQEQSKNIKDIFTIEEGISTASEGVVNTYLNKNKYAVGYLNGSVEIRSALNHEIMLTLKTNLLSVNEIVKIDTSVIAVGGKGKQIQIWDINEGKLLKMFQTQFEMVTALLYLGDDLLAIGGQIKNGSIQIWNIETEELEVKLEGHTRNVYDLKLFNHSVLISASYDKTVRFWNLESGAEIENKRIEEGAPIGKVEILNDKEIAIGNREGNIMIFNTKTLETKYLLKAHKEIVFSIKKLKSGLILSSGNDQTLKLWDYVSGVLVKEFKFKGNVHSISSFGSDKIITCGDEKRIKIWNI